MSNCQSTAKAVKAKQGKLFFSVVFLPAQSASIEVNRQPRLAADMHRRTLKNGKSNQAFHGLDSGLASPRRPRRRSPDCCQFSTSPFMRSANLNSKCLETLFASKNCVIQFLSYTSRFPISFERSSLLLPHILQVFYQMRHAQLNLPRIALPIDPTPQNNFFFLHAPSTQYYHCCTRPAPPILDEYHIMP
jgi:hypothetical protein